MTAEFRSSTGFAAIRLAALAWVIAVLPIGILIALSSDTWTGRAFALATMIFAVLPVAAAVAYLKSHRQLWHAVLIGTVASGIASAFVILRAPTGRSSDARVANYFSQSDEHSFRLALTNLLPEEDQLLAGFMIAPAIDPLLTTEQSGRLRELTRQVYRQLEADPGFHALGSAMGFTYQDIVSSSPGARHCYTYVPANLDHRKPARLLIFFHGSGGNFKAYLWLLSKIADQVGLVTAAPTGGFGAWPASECGAQFNWALDAARHVSVIDPDHITIMGLSNGGVALSRLIQTSGTRFDAAIFVSPVFDQAALQSSAFADQCRGKRILVISGVRDDRVPIDYVHTKAATMKSAGAHVEELDIDSADHFLIFSHSGAVAQRLAAWFKESGLVGTRHIPEPYRYIDSERILSLSSRSEAN